MERTKLKAAREARGLREGRRLSQQDVADAIGCSREVYSLWERGLSDPQEYWIGKLCEFYEVTDPKDLDIQKKMTAPRRQVLQMIVGAGATGALMSFEHTSLSPEEFLLQCNAAINGCWKLLAGNDMITAESILATYISTISSLTMRPSHIQSDAASLGTQIKLQQVIIASRRIDYKTREFLCKDAVRLSKLSRDTHLYLTALEWQADTYTNCYHQPQRAIPILNDSLTCLNSDAQLNKSAISSNLAVAHAQQGNETNALDMIEQAKGSMPKHPELDPLYPCIDFGPSELDAREGMVYLELAEHLPNSDYAQKAYKAYDLSTGKQATSQARRGLHLIRKAEIACVLGDLHLYADCLEQAIPIALNIDSKRHISKSRTALGKAPEVWRKEERYQDLVKMF